MESIDIYKTIYDFFVYLFVSIYGFKVGLDIIFRKKIFIPLFPFRIYIWFFKIIFGNKYAKNLTNQWLLPKKQLFIAISYLLGGVVCLWVCIASIYIFIVVI